jgi:hypothetical protein
MGDVDLDSEVQPQLATRLPGLAEVKKLTSYVTSQPARPREQVMSVLAAASGAGGSLTGGALISRRSASSAHHGQL